MVEISAKSVFRGIAIGCIKYLDKEENVVVRVTTEDTEGEIARYEAARQKAIDQLGKLYEKAVAKVGEENAEIFNVHAMMLEDEDYEDSVKNIIRTQSVNAEYAIAATGDNFANMFASMEDEYFRARSADVKDISERLIRILNGKEEETNLSEPVILMADDLTPSETVQLDKSKLLAFVTMHGSANSHTAILARTMGIPALVQADISKKYDGQMGIVDGFEGKLIVEPEMSVYESYQKKKAEEDDKKQLLQQLKGKENITKSGKKINLYANIGNPGDLAKVLENDAGGIGLFRSEFLYLESDNFPSEEQQFEAYRKVLETMGSKKVIIRTLDIGADKQVGYFNLDKEENPALGYRAIRICLARPEIFRTQLRALYRASAFGNLSIMYPMIISLKEVKEIKEISKSVREELVADGIRIGEVEEGIMIETPAAAIMSQELAKEVDFFSIGTNDLTQYTLAIDRQNEKLDRFYDPHHPAILHLIQMVCENAHKAGIWVGICGELGADTELTEQFVKMGVDELSVSPGCVLQVRKVIRELD